MKEAADGMRVERPVDLIEMFIREHSFLPHQWIIHKAAVWRPCVFCQDFLSWNRSVVEILSDPRCLLQLRGFKGACSSFWQMALKRYSPLLLWRHISSPLWASDCYFLLSALHVRTRFITEMAFCQFLVYNGEFGIQGLANISGLWRYLMAHATYGEMFQHFTIQALLEQNTLIKVRENSRAVLAFGIQAKYGENYGNLFPPWDKKKR